MKRVAPENLTEDQTISLIADGFRMVGRTFRELVQSQQPTMRQRAKWQRGFGNFLVSVANAEDPSSSAREAEHLTRAANEVDASAGGFLVGPQWSDDLILSAYEESVITQLVDRRETSNPLAEVKIPGIDETSRADGSRYGGFLSYWAAESASVPPTFPRTKLVEFTGRKIIIVTRASRELLYDAPMLGSVINKGFAAEAGFKLDAAIFSGSGAGVPLGMMNSPALITVAKATGQAAGTIVGENVTAMWARLPAPCRRRAVWLINEDAEGQLENLGGASGAALYMPAGTSGGNAYPLLKGRPVLVIEQSPVLGAVGDIALVDPTQYILLDGGMKSALSVHARFDNDEVVFRFTWRVDGRGAYSSPITPYNGSSTRSPFVALAAR